MSNWVFLTVGATIEDMDIKDLQYNIAETDNVDLAAVFQNLMKGSRNHLRAFVSLLERNGISYTAHYLEQEEIDEIVSSEWERGIVDAGGVPISTVSVNYRKGRNEYRVTKLLP